MNEKACVVSSGSRAETIYLADDIFKCPTMHCRLLSQKRHLQPFATKMLHKRFRQHQETDGSEQNLCKTPTSPPLSRMLWRLP